MVSGGNKVKTKVLVKALRMQSWSHPHPQVLHLRILPTGMESTQKAHGIHRVRWGIAVIPAPCRWGWGQEDQFKPILNYVELGWGVQGQLRLNAVLSTNKQTTTKQRQICICTDYVQVYCVFLLCVEMVLWFYIAHLCLQFGMPASDSGDRHVPLHLFFVSFFPF